MGVYVWEFCVMHCIDQAPALRTVPLTELIRPVITVIYEPRVEGIIYTVPSDSVRVRGSGIRVITARAAKGSAIGFNTLTEELPKIIAAITILLTNCTLITRGAGTITAVSLEVVSGLIFTKAETVIMYKITAAASREIRYGYLTIRAPSS
jgi:hypothetical protein